MNLAVLFGLVAGPIAAVFIAGKIAAKWKKDDAATPSKAVPPQDNQPK